MVFGDFNDFDGIVRDLADSMPISRVSCCGLCSFVIYFSGSFNAEGD